MGVVPQEEGIGAIVDAPVREMRMRAEEDCYYPAGVCRAYLGQETKRVVMIAVVAVGIWLALWNTDISTHLLDVGTRPGRRMNAGNFAAGRNNLLGRGGIGMGWKKDRSPRAQIRERIQRA